MKKWLKVIMCLSLIGLILGGCGNTKGESATFSSRTGSALKEDTEESTEDEETTETAGDLYIIEELDMAGETITFYCISNSKQYKFSYNMTTKFLDKYGNSSSVTNFENGTVVEIGDKLPNSGALSEVQMSDEVWTYEDVSSYTIDLEKNMLTTGGSNYKLSSSTKVYSDENRVLLTDIGESDVLKIVGKDKDILTIAITTGHGYLAVSNTELFDGSLIFIGTKIVSMLYGDTTIEVPEGTYTITVANDGWGGSGEYTVVRDEVTPVNLDDIKGDGPKYCDLTFIVTVPDTYVYIDGEMVNTDDVVSVKYGSHNLVVTCSGYSSWNKTLVVNSSSATITLSLEEEDSSTSTSTDTTDTTDSTDTETSETTTTDTTTSTDDYDYETDYLSTISDILSSILD